MVQLELDPRYLQPERSVEIDSNRSKILRKVIVGGGLEWRKTRRYHPILFEEALSTILGSSYDYFERSTEIRGEKLDLLVGRVLKRALPFLQGEKGNFESFSHFMKTMYGSIVHHVAVDQYRVRKTVEHKRGEDSDNQLTNKERRRSRAEGFQPTLFSLKRARQISIQNEPISSQLLADLKDPDAVLSPEYLSSLPMHRQRALELRYRNPHFTSADIVQVLRLEGYGEFNESAVRVWKLRARRTQKQKELVGV